MKQFLRWLSDSENRVACRARDHASIRVKRKRIFRRV